MEFSKFKKEGEWAMNHGQETYSNEMEWQFRVSILPTQDNIDKAYQALSNVNQFNPGDHPDAKLMLVTENTIHTWDGTLMDASDRDQRGKELCVYMDTHFSGSFAFSPEYFKELMLDIWKALEDAGVELSYITPTYAEKEISSDSDILTPFSYSSSKPYDSPDGILHSDNYNPKNYEDPLEGLHFSKADLKKKGIKNYNALTVSAKRIQYMKNHIEESKAHFNKKLNNLTDARSSYLQKKYHTFNLINDFQPNLSILENVKDNIAFYFPSNFVKGARSSLFNKNLKKEELTQQFLIDEYKQIQQDAEGIVENLIYSLQEISWPIEKLSNEEIADLVRRHPREMQSMQRQFIHLEHEMTALTIEQEFHEALEAKQSEQSKLKLTTIATAVLKTATVGATAGTLLGVGVGAALVATGLFAPFGVGVLGILAVSATIGLASSALGALFVGLTSMLIETIRYKAPLPVPEHSFSIDPDTTVSGYNSNNHATVYGASV